MRQYDVNFNEGTLSRIHVGLEHPQDLIEDLKKRLNVAYNYFHTFMMLIST